MPIRRSERASRAAMQALTFGETRMTLTAWMAALASNTAVIGLSSGGQERALGIHMPLPPARAYALGVALAGPAGVVASPTDQVIG